MPAFPPEPDPQPSAEAPSARARFRVRYPLRERPVFRSPGLVAFVRDFSETGMTITPPIGTRAALEPDERLTGVIAFRHAPSAPIDGVVLRITGAGVVIAFDRAGVTWAAVQAEERAILARHPV